MLLGLRPLEDKAVLNQATLSGRIGRLRWIDAEVGLIRIAQNYPGRPTEWFTVFVPAKLFPAAVEGLHVGTEAVFTGRLRSRQETYGRGKVDKIELVASAFVVGKTGCGESGDEDPRDQFVESRRRRVGEKSVKVGTR